MDKEVKTKNLDVLQKEFLKLKEIDDNIGGCDYVHCGECPFGMEIGCGSAELHHLLKRMRGCHHGSL